ncbi:MAG: hypothetical protein E6J90_03115 [Deltaproteobacteria bacterium]|nr:MAG: hypothetical protein E6J90_03115 [Deltaproteobacteria bacterium]
MQDSQKVVRSAPSCFHCLLDEQPGDLVPARLLAKLRTADGGAALEANPSYWLAPTGALPAPIAASAPHVEGLALDHPIIWLQDTATGMLAPFWLGPRYSALLAELTPGQASDTRQLSAEECAVLQAAGVLVTPGELARRSTDTNEELAHAARAFGRGYATLGDLIHPFHLDALRRHYREMIRQGAFMLGDGQSPRRYIAHNEAVARFFHHQLAGVVSRVAGAPVKPSYTFLASYLDGAVLPEHVDRPQCEYSITLLIDFSPEPARESPWPIHLHGEHGIVTVHQGIGDALIYRGRQIPHSRARLPDGCASTSLLFHYVDESFSKSLD